MLTKAKISKLEAREKDYVVYDSQDLFLRIYPSGRKKWICRRRVRGKDIQKTLGEYPVVGIIEARQKRDELLISGQGRGMNLKTLTEMWMKERRIGKVSDSMLSDTNRRIKALSCFMLRDIRDIKRPEVVEVLRNLAAEKSPDAARRTAMVLKQIFDFAADIGELEDPHCAVNLSRALPIPTHTNFASIHDTKEIGRMLRMLNTVRFASVRAALWTAAYCFPRTGEILKAQWREIDFEKAIWTIPSEHTKRRRELLVPLSRQMIELLKKLGGGTSEELIFESMYRSRLINFLYYSRKLPPEIRPKPMTVHGFRSMASTILNEHGWPSDAIERQLAHVSGGVRAVYNKAQYLDTRREMLQWYADYLDALRDGTPVPDKKWN